MSIEYLVAFVLANMGVSVEVVCAVRHELLDFFSHHLAVLSVVLNRPEVRPLGTVVDEAEPLSTSLGLGILTYRVRIRILASIDTLLDLVN